MGRRVRARTRPVMRRRRRAWLLRWDRFTAPTMLDSFRSAHYPRAVALVDGDWRFVTVRKTRRGVRVTGELPRDDRLLSGSWRTVDGKLTLVEILLVPAPGFPLARR